MVSKAPEPLSLRFDSFAADLQTCELRKGDRPVKLQPQPFKLLVLLASKPGELVTREEIQKELWSDDTFVDFEHGINYSIQQIRNALGESADKPRFVQTVPRRGYRFITAVEAEGARPVSPREENENPYPGLTAFTESDAEFFFGREEEVDILKQKLQHRRLLALIGASGAGKTSSPPGRTDPIPSRELVVGVLRAGLFSTSKPSSRPSADICRRHESDGEARVPGKYRAGPSVLHIWRNDRKKLCSSSISSKSSSPSTSRRINLVLQTFWARRQVKRGFGFFFSLRDDFLLRCSEYEPLRQIFESLTPLIPPKEPALRRILVEPAQKQGYVFEDDELVDAMLSEVKDERGALPLLAFAASRMWAKRDRKTKRLTWDAYREIDGVGGALAQHAEAVLERIGAEQHDTVREIFRNLITAQGTRVGRSREELLSVFEDPRSGRSRRSGARQCTTTHHL